MRIEIAVPTDRPNKDRGDLLEKLSARLLRAQNYRVVEQVRVTGTELDLLCEHSVSRKRIYVECKAHRDALSAKPLREILGTVRLRSLEEGWLISAGPLGKDAKGIQQDWEDRPAEDRQALSIYTPDRVIASLVKSNVLVAVPGQSAKDLVQKPDRIGEWTMLVTPYGDFWCVTTVISGLPAGVLVFEAHSGNVVRDSELLARLQETDSTLRTLDFSYSGAPEPEPDHPTDDDPRGRVVQVEHGESWEDYRPARPEDFVGRVETQRRILRFFDDVRAEETSTRVFAVTGDTGVGKSSLIAKLRDRTRNVRNRNKFFVYAVDVRAAGGPEYVLWALLACLRDAAKNGFGTLKPDDLELTNYSDPLASESIEAFTDSLQERKQMVALVFDQFEELYSKPELFSVFEEARRLLVACASAQTNLVLGFAWRADSTVQQGHPAYYMWHSLADHRYETRLGPFTHSEVASALTSFEKELGQKLKPALRRQLSENSQGFPWLLKKLCIHLFEQVRGGASQEELMNKALDVQSLFDRDTKGLSKPETACLEMIARDAPADWYQVMDAFSPEVLRALQDKRLVVRSGRRVNLYWDIFKEYVLTGRVPDIPFTYVPHSPSLKSLLRVAAQLHAGSERDFAELASECNLGEKTVGNVVRDLTMFGIATAELGHVQLEDGLEEPTPENVLERLKSVLATHALTLHLGDHAKDTLVTVDEIVIMLRSLNPAAKHDPHTWTLYADKMGQYLTATGFLEPASGGWLVTGGSDVTLPEGFLRRSHGFFTGAAPPHQVVEVLNRLREEGPISLEDLKAAGLRNAVTVLLLLRLAQGRDGIVIAESTDDSTAAEAVRRAALESESMKFVAELLTEDSGTRGPEIGKLVDEHFDRDWSATSQVRSGNSLRRWAVWIIAGRDQGVPGPRVRADRIIKDTGQGSLFKG